ncbi:branched-chain amino acid ABC transporter permease [Dankookia sp. P2]|uniref:branched-chain amino acid ABC transporter permease n=1 Tax=Dankookia sp. P2 TaxID=3423955 RepID=UPI003D667605
MALANNLAAPQPVALPASSPLAALWPFAALLGLAVLLPLTGNEYWALIATRACIYWVLVSGLNLIVGYAGQLAIGYVSLLTIGAYTAAVLAAGNLFEPVHPFLALAVAALMGAVFGVVVGLPALRLRTFYFAMTTLGFATIVTQVALAWQDVTGAASASPGRPCRRRSIPPGASTMPASRLPSSAPGSPATSPAAASAAPWSRCGMRRWRRRPAASPSRGC